jgi:hypothetical protein
VVMLATVRTTSTSSSRGWTRLLYPVRMISLSEKLYSRGLMLDHDECAILAFQTECRLALSVRLPIGFCCSKQNVDLYLFIFLFFLEIDVYALLSCFLRYICCGSSYLSSEFNGHLSLFLTPSIPNYYLF